MSPEVKLEMRKKANLIRGLVNILQDDAIYICADVNDFDLVGLGVSIEETKDTIQRLIDRIAELEYSVYLSKQTGP